MAQPPLPLQLFLPLQPLSLLLQPPWPLQLFFPLQECLCMCALRPLKDMLPADTAGADPEGARTEAFAVVPAIRPETAAAKRRALKLLFIENTFHS